MLRSLSAKETMDYKSFEHEFEKLTGVRLELYKEKQMKRRIDTLIGRKGFHDYEDFLSGLRSNPDELEEFLDYITINVTEFFRTAEQWNCMETEALTDLLQKKDRIRIWSTACATGEEAYSMAMSLSKTADPSRFHILATDVNEKVLRFAEKGIYSENIVGKLPEDKRGFFEKSSDGMHISDELRSSIEFRKLDLLKDRYPEDCDLIVCRNVLIYFTEEAKEQIFTKFKQSLSPGGWLFTGNTEQLIYHRKFGLQKVKSFLYQND